MSNLKRVQGERGIALGPGNGYRKRTTRREIVRRWIWLLCVVTAVLISPNSRAQEPVPLPPEGLSEPPQLEPNISPVLDLRFNLVADRLDTLDARVPQEDPDISFLLSRMEMGLAGHVAPSISVHGTVDLRQNHGLVSYDTGDGDTQSIPAFPEGWQARTRRAWAQWESGKWGNIRLGVQEKVLGLSGTYKETDAYYMGGVRNFQSLAVYTGVVPDASLGLRWDRNLGDRAQVLLQITNTSDSGEQEIQNDKDLVGRLRLAPLDGLTIAAGGMMGRRSDGQIRVWTAAVDYRLEPFRGIVEVLEARQDSLRSLGWSVTLAGDRESSGRISSRLDHLTLLARVRSFDEDAEVAEDSSIHIAGALNLYWRATGNTTVMTGLVHEVVIPEDTEAAIEHGAVGQVRLSF